MLRYERRLLKACLIVGASLTALVLAIDFAGLLRPAENFLYDLRAQTCQRFVRPPTDKLVHLDIDDRSLEVIGGWPWERRKWARIFEELRLADPKAIEMDVIFAEPQRVQYAPRPTTGPTSRPVEYELIDNDAELAEAIRRCGTVMIPVSLDAVERRLPMQERIFAELLKDVELDEADLRKKLQSEGLSVEETFGNDFIRLRRDAIDERLEKDFTGSNEVSFDEVRARLLRKSQANVNTSAVRVLRDRFEQFQNRREAFRFALPTPPGMQSLFDMRIKLAPIRQLSSAAVGSSFVDYPQFEGPTIRSVPLLLKVRGQVFVQMGFALASRMLDGDLSRMKVDARSIILPLADGHELVIPIAPPRISNERRVVTNLLDVPWIGPRNWELMYDRGKGGERVNHVSIKMVWEACSTTDQIIRNNELIDDSLRVILQELDEGQLKRLRQAPFSPEDFESRRQLSEELLRSPVLQQVRESKVDELPAEYREIPAASDGLRKALQRSPELIEQRAALRAELSKAMKGKAVLVGWIATAAVADFVPTSLHEKCPGVVVHGAVFNGIMSGELWRRAPTWVAVVATLLLGMITAFAVGRLTPYRALLVVLALMAAYAVLNGLVLFDYLDTIVGAAAPLVAIVSVWAGCTLTRVVVEQTERARITRRFGNYADSKLVDYVLEHPDVTFEGENREVTVVFTDLAGFTRLSEKLGEKVVGLLNELLEELVPVIRDSHQGYVNKFMGDGIMFFYNAPRTIRDHAADAVATVLDMQLKLTEFNIRLSERGLSELAMRAGVASGDVIVGDAGGGGRSDYTCLGNAVNLSSRLEAANKYTGTHTLINDRAAELLEGQFLIRPIGRIQVVGQEQAGMCYEPICPAAQATEQQRELATRTAAMVEAFTVREFGQCINCADALDAAFAPGKLTATYRGMCERYLREGVPNDFDGRIVLTEK